MFNSNKRKQDMAQIQHHLKRNYDNLQYKINNVMGWNDDLTLRDLSKMAEYLYVYTVSIAELSREIREMRGRLEAKNDNDI